MNPRPPRLILIAHGSEKRPQAADFLLNLASGVRALGQEVHALFMRGQPNVDQISVLAADGDPLVVVPVFMGRGYYTDQLVPKALGAVDYVYTPPLGCHPDMPDLIAARAERVAQSAGVDAARATLMLVAHGSARSGGSGDTPKALAEAIARQHRFAQVAVSFLEQAPKATDWRELVPTGDLVVMPLVLAQGLHGSHDIPQAFGFGPEGGMRREESRTLVLAGGLGLDAELPRLILDLARLGR